ncbi:MAG: hypothetical protein ACE3L7_10935 [Candidatus Pristimantibacillus sp.]
MESKQQINEVLQAMDSLFEHFFEWLEQQYDPSSGGFYYARSSKEGYTPDIESTAQALNIMVRCGLLPSWDEQKREHMVQFFHNKQRSDSGYFYDEHPDMCRDEVMVGRAIGYCTNALRKLGSSPRYSLPSEQNSSPSYMQSPATYRSWLESVELSNSWRGCDRISVSTAYLSQLDEAQLRPYLDEAFSWFESVQDSATGLWGSGSRYVRISGTFKLHLFYDRFDVPLTREQQLFESIKQTLAEDEAKDMCYIRNPIHLLSYMHISMSDAEILDILKATYSNMKKLLRADGGFSRELHRSPPAPNVAQVKDGEWYPDMPSPVCIGAGKVEGDMNAGTQAVLIRSLCYALAGIKEVPFKSHHQLKG